MAKKAVAYYFAKVKNVYFRLNLYGYWFNRQFVKKLAKGKSKATLGKIDISIVPILYLTYLLQENFKLVKVE